MLTVIRRMWSLRAERIRMPVLNLFWVVKWIVILISLMVQT